MRQLVGWARRLARNSPGTKNEVTRSRAPRSKRAPRSGNLPSCGHGSSPRPPASPLHCDAEVKREGEAVISLTVAVTELCRTWSATCYRAFSNFDHPHGGRRACRIVRVRRSARFKHTPPDAVDARARPNHPCDAGAGRRRRNTSPGRGPGPTSTRTAACRRSQAAEGGLCGRGRRSVRGPCRRDITTPNGAERRRHHLLNAPARWGPVRRCRVRAPGAGDARHGSARSCGVTHDPRVGTTTRSRKSRPHRLLVGHRRRADPIDGPSDADR